MTNQENFGKRNVMLLKILYNKNSNSLKNIMFLRVLLFKAYLFFVIKLNNESWNMFTSNNILVMTEHDFANTDIAVLLFIFIFE